MFSSPLRSIGMFAALLAAQGARAQQPVFVHNCSGHTVLIQAKSSRMQINLCLYYLDRETDTVKAYPVDTHTTYHLADSATVTIQTADTGRPAEGSFQIVYPPSGLFFQCDEFQYLSEPPVLGEPSKRGDYTLDFVSLHSSLDGPLYAEAFTPRSIVIFKNPGRAAQGVETKAAPAEETKDAAAAAPPAKAKAEEHIEQT